MDLSAMQALEAARAAYEKHAQFQTQLFDPRDTRKEVDQVGKTAKGV